MHPEQLYDVAQRLRVIQPGRELLSQQRYADAVPLLRRAAETYSDDSSLWYELSIAAAQSQQEDVAFDAIQRGLRHHPRDAKLWRHLAHLYEKQKEWASAVEAYKTIDELGEATADDLNRCGVGYYQQQLFLSAARYYQASAALEPAAVQYYNLGLALRQPAVARDLDAADAFQLSLNLNKHYHEAHTELTEVEEKLKPLCIRAHRQAAETLRADDAYEVYLNPFEAFRLSDVTDVAHLNPKIRQHARKQLSHEIRLNDGLVSWLGNRLLDESAVRNLVPELRDETRRRYHWYVYRNQPLLRFLTRGEIGHFLYTESRPDIEILELLEREPGFRTFLSQPFTQQYRRILKRALDHNQFDVIAALQSGRRWVDPACDDDCYQPVEGHFLKLGASVKEVSRGTPEDWPRPVKSTALFLSQNHLIELFNLLPGRFETERVDLVTCLRQMALDSNNHHQDATSACDLVRLCLRIRTADEELRRTLEQDLKTLEQNLETVKERNASKLEAMRMEAMRSLLTTVKPSEEATAPALILGGIIILLCFGLYAASSSSSTPPITPPPTFPSAKYTSNIIEEFQSANGPSNSRPQAPYDEPNTESRDVYRVPGHVTAELGRDSRAIELERGKLTRLEAQLQTLGQEIDGERRFLDATSESEVNRFNRRVTEHNALKDEVENEQRRFNRLVESYNAKLKRYGQ